MICAFECVRGHTQLGIKATGARSAIRIHAATMHVCVLCSPIPPSPNPDPPPTLTPIWGYTFCTLGAIRNIEPNCFLNTSLSPVILGLCGIGI